MTVELNPVAALNDTSKFAGAVMLIAPVMSAPDTVKLCDADGVPTAAVVNASGPPTTEIVGVGGGGAKGTVPETVRICGAAPVLACVIAPACWLPEPGLYLAKIVVAAIVLVLQSDRARPAGLAFMAGWLVGLAATTAVFAQVPRLLDGQMRRSYVLWIEGATPLVVLEYVSGDGIEERDRTPTPAG